MVPQKTSLSVSKFTPPRLPRIVYRSRLLKLIEQNKDKKLLLILGQAAQGKSTLAASYVHNLEIPSAWVNLSEEDSDPVNLFYSLVHALQYVLKEVDLSPALSYPSVTTEPRLEVPLYREWTNAMFERITVPVQIVLDGLDRLSSDAPSFGFLQVILDGLPQHIHSIFLSREMPPLKIQDLKVKQEALVLTNEELAFTQDEVKEFFREGRGISFTLGELRRIHQFTEGWIGGVILLAETLDRMPDEPRRKYISEDIPDEFKREVFQYFGDEILSSQPEPVRDFLIKLSILDSIDQVFVRDLVGMENAGEVLQDLARKNLFVQSIYTDRKGLLFRYHQLFKDYLRAKFESQKTENEKRALFFKAGSLYEKRGELEDSMKYYLKAKAHEHAASVLQHMGMDLLKTGRTTDLSRWLAALPEKLVQESPWLLFYLCMTRRFTGVRENLSSLPKALAAFKEREDIRGQFLTLSSLLEAIIAAGLRWSHLAQSLDQAETLLESTNPDLFPYARAVLLSQFGYGHTLRGNLRRGFLALQNAFLLSSNLKDPMLQADTLGHVIVALVFLGDYSLGDEYSQKLEKLAGDFRLPELQTLYFIANSMLATFKGDEEKAKKLTELAEEYVERHGLIYYYPVTLSYNILYCVFSEKYAEMDQVGNQLLRMASSMGNLVLAASTTFFLGLNSYRKGELNKAKKLIDRSHKLCSPEETNTQVQWYSSKVIKALISLDLSDDHGNGDGLEEALEFFRKVNNPRLMAETHLATALLESKQGETDAAARSLAQGFKRAEEVKHNHFLLLSRNHRVKACSLALELGLVDEAQLYLTELNEKEHILSTTNLISGIYIVIKFLVVVFLDL